LQHRNLSDFGFVDMWWCYDIVVGHAEPEWHLKRCRGEVPAHVLHFLLRTVTRTQRQFSPKITNTSVIGGSSILANSCVVVRTRRNTPVPFLPCHFACSRREPLQTVWHRGQLVNPLHMRSLKPFQSPRPSKHSVSHCILHCQVKSHKSARST
jgi:hypothetical protein